MRSALVFLLWIHQLTDSEVRSVSVGIIRDVSLDIIDADPTIVNGTCEDCVCSLLADPAFFALNCRSDDLVCELHSTQDQNRSFNLLAATGTSFFFLSLPTFVATATMNDECIQEITSTSTGE